MTPLRVACQVENHVHKSKTAKVPKLLVDTGSEHTWTLEGMNLQVDPRAKKLVAAGPLPAA